MKSCRGTTHQRGRCVEGARGRLQLVRGKSRGRARGVAVKLSQPRPMPPASTGWPFSGSHADGLVLSRRRCAQRAGASLRCMHRASNTRKPAVLWREDSWRFGGDCVRCSSRVHRREAFRSSRAPRRPTSPPKRAPIRRRRHSSARRHARVALVVVAARRARSRCPPVICQLGLGRSNSRSRSGVYISTGSVTAAAGADRRTSSGDPLSVGFQAERLAQLGRQRDDAALLT